MTNFVLLLPWKVKYQYLIIFINNPSGLKIQKQKFDILLVLFRYGVTSVDFKIFLRSILAGHTYMCDTLIHLVSFYLQMMLF